MKKSKIFLGGYLNYTNAQNLNCLALAKYLDKNKFEIYSLTCHFGKNDIGVKALDDSVNLFYCSKPFLITKYLGYIWGVLKCNIAYLPKHSDTSIWILRFARLLGKKIFTTIEINMCDRSKDNKIDSLGGPDKMKKYFNLIPNIYGITKFLIRESKCGVQLNNTPLYLGVDENSFKLSSINSLLNIVFIGNLIKRKNLDEVLDLALHFRALTFHIIGDGSLRDELEERASGNVIFHGK